MGGDEEREWEREFSRERSWNSFFHFYSFSLFAVYFGLVMDRVTRRIEEFFKLCVVVVVFLRPIISNNAPDPPAPIPPPSPMPAFLVVLFDFLFEVDFGLDDILYVPNKQ